MPCSQFDCDRATKNSSGSTDALTSYRTSFQGDCSPNDSWASPALAFIPNLLRFTQSLRRWHDSGLYIHLINAGKYSVSAAQIWVYFAWRIVRRPPRWPG